MSVSVADNIAKVIARIRAAEHHFQRPDSSVTLMAVSKTRDADAVREASECGIVDFGENYLQEALEKINALSELNLCWHFIGPIQSNKTRAIAEHFDWVHSVDRFKIAQRLNDQRPTHLPSLNICLQINISEEASKSGITPDELPKLIEQIETLPKLRLRGLMAIPASSKDLEQQRLPFKQMSELFQACQKQSKGMDTLSMGMSGDMEAAIAEGSTMVRIGTDIFGPRAPKPPQP